MKPNAVWWVLVKLYQEGRCESLLLSVYEGEWKDGNYIESCKKSFWAIIWGRFSRVCNGFFCLRFLPFLKEDHHSHFTVRTWEFFPPLFGFNLFYPFDRKRLVQLFNELSLVHLFNESGPVNPFFLSVYVCESGNVSGGWSKFKGAFGFNNLKNCFLLLSLPCASLFFQKIFPFSFY